MHPRPQADQGRCDSPLKLKKLKPGKHKVEIAAVDLAGNVDQTPVKAKLKIKKPKKHKKAESFRVQTTRPFELEIWHAAQGSPAILSV